MSGMSAVAKLGIAAVVIIFVGGAAAAGGLYYVAHRVSQKIHQVADRVIGSSSDSRGESSSTARPSSEGRSTGDVCRLLSKEDVSHAIGVEIVHTQPVDNGCTYIAKGTQADMSAKNVTAMIAARGADKQTQQTIQKFAGGMFNVFQSEKPASEQDTSGEVPVFSFSVVSVQDTALNVPADTTITMTCATYNGEVDHSKLTAIAVDAIN